MRLSNKYYKVSSIRYLYVTYMTYMVYKISPMVSRTTFFTFVFIILLSGCHQKSRFHITTFENPVEVKINRFDLDFIALDTTDLINGLKRLEQKYPAFYPVFLSDILMMNPDDTLDNANQIRDFLKDSAFIKVHQDVKKVFANTDTIESRLSTAYSYVTHYFPGIQLPEVYFFVSGFNNQYLINKSIIGIGSDLYLGATYPIYKDLAYEYLIPDMRKEMVATDVLSTILHNEFSFIGDINLLNAMIYEGKMLYLLTVILPEETPENITGFSKEALNWCKQYEKDIWEKMIENKQLFSTDQLLINQYINNAPFTSPVSQDSPGRIGRWVGWQIVQSYMQNNKETGLRDLMNTESAQFILEQSKYRP